MDKKMEKLLKLLQDNAKLTVQQLAAMLDLGHGSGPMNHMYALRENG